MMESSLLDEKLLVFMEQLETLQEKRAALNTLTEQGWFSMSKARYSMGNKQVSALQFASEMEPLVRVQSRTCEDGTTEFVTDRKSLVEDVGPTEGVRRRVKSKQRSSDEGKSDDEGDQESGKKRNPVPGQDPLVWFGILVPQTLKQAQTSFKRAIELSAEVATLQTTVLRTRQELQSLLHQTQKSESS